MQVMYQQVNGIKAIQQFKECLFSKNKGPSPLLVEQCFRIQETIFATIFVWLQDCKEDNASRRIYKLLMQVHSECRQTVTMIEETGAVIREIRDLEEQVRLNHHFHKFSGQSWLRPGVTNIQFSISHVFYFLLLIFSRASSFL